MKCLELRYKKFSNEKNKISYDLIVQCLKAFSEMIIQYSQIQLCLLDIQNCV